MNVSLFETTFAYVSLRNERSRDEIARSDLCSPIKKKKERERERSVALKQSIRLEFNNSIIYFENTPPYVVLQSDEY